MNAAYYLAALLKLCPQPVADPVRFQTIADGLSIAAAEFLPRWRGTERELAAAQLTAVRFESNAREDVHFGIVIGGAGEECLMQIHPKNVVWKKHAANFQDLVGVELGRTVQCLRAGTESLVNARAKCSREGYRKNLNAAMFSSYHMTGCWTSMERFRRAKMMNNILRGKI